MATHKALSPKQFPYWANSTAMKMVPALVAAERLDLMICSNGVTRTAASDTAVLSRYNGILRKSCGTVDELAAEFGEYATAFEIQFGRESRQEAFFSADSRFKVTDKDVTNYYNSYSNSLATAEKYNSNAFLRATNVCARLKAGEEWIKVAKEETDEGKDAADKAAATYYEFWEDLYVKNSQEPEVVEAVTQLKPGEWTAPIETGEGIVIAKFLGRDAESGAYKCARILIQLAILPQEVSPKNLPNYLTAKKRKRYEYSIREDLVADYPAQFPLGTNFTYKIWSEPKQLKKGFNVL